MAFGRSDARLPMAIGFALVGTACFMAGQLTHDWISDDFLLSQIVQAVGQSFAVTSVIWFALKHLPESGHKLPSRPGAQGPNLSSSN